MKIKTITKIEMTEEELVSFNNVCGISFSIKENLLKISKNFLRISGSVSCLNLKEMYFSL